MSDIIVYTDGACKGNPGPGGYAAIILQNGSEKVVQGSNKQTTNNIMELTAVLESLKVLVDKHSNKSIQYFVDSEYVVKGINIWSNGWKKNGWKTKTGKVKNLEIWKEILLLKDKFKRIKFEWVRGHDDNELNERCDQIARANIK